VCVRGWGYVARTECSFFICFINRTGYDSLIMSRFDLHAILLSRVPKERILMNHKIESILQDKHKVTIRCTNNTFHQADVLVGADGAYSAVRQSLYDRLTMTGKLPEADLALLKISHTTYLGTTKPLDPKNFIGLEEPVSHCDTILGTNRAETVIVSSYFRCR
jgi:2-polyprenyl-6-methoxyphenol hydroxylase-like FAD-dependent oxidoreductase